MLPLVFGASFSSPPYVATGAVRIFLRSWSKPFEIILTCGIRGGQDQVSEIRR